MARSAAHTAAHAPTTQTFGAVPQHIFDPSRPADTKTTEPEPAPRYHTSLAALPAYPVVQRKEDCCSDEEPKIQRKIEESEERDEDQGTTVQPRLEVGPANDAYEREADSIASRVMKMPEGDTSDVSSSKERVQRDPAGWNTGEEKETVRRQAEVEAEQEDGETVRRLPIEKTEEENETVRRLPEVESEEQDETVRTKPLGSVPGTKLGTTATELTSGGRPLLDSTRGFYESRMRRDLSMVRVHTGNRSSQLTRSIQAHSFTYNNHIWLGAGEGMGPSLTMAHELAHVLQQTQPEGLNGGGSVPSVRARPRSQRCVQRKKKPKFVVERNTYWTSSDLEHRRKNSGIQIHEDVLPTFQKAYPELFIEVAIPRKPRGGKAKYGRADLYGGIRNGRYRTIGLNFKSEDKPTSLRRPRAQKESHKRYNHAKSARPYYDSRGKGHFKIKGLSQAPDSIILGELKPRGKLGQGEKQLRSYVDGINNTRSWANAFKKKNYKGKSPAPEWSKLSIKRLDKQAPTPTGKGLSFGRKKLEVHQFVVFKPKDARAVGTKLVHKPQTPVWGHLRLKKSRSGVYLYWWEPEVKRGTATALPKTLTPHVKSARQMMKALRTTRKVVLPHRQQKPRKEQPTIRCQKRRRPLKPIQDGFNKAAWERNRKKIAGDYSRWPGKHDILTDHYLLSIDSRMGEDKQNLASRFSAKQGDRVKDFRRIRLIASPFAYLIPKVREKLGRIFVRVSKLYAKIKQRFQGRATPKKGVKAGGFLGALAKAALKIILVIGGQVVAATMSKLMARLRTCATAMLQDWFNPDFFDSVQKRVNGFKTKYEEKIDSFLGASPEELVDKLFQKYKPFVDKIRTFFELVEKVGPLITIYRVVRWGIQAVACLTPPIAGCLWGLAVNVILEVAGGLMQTCWFMKRVTKKVLQFGKVKEFINNTSSNLTKSILETGSKIFPAPLGPFLAKCGMQAPKVETPPAESVCEGLGNEPRPTKEEARFWRRWVNLPWEKRKWILKMMGRKNAEGGTRASWAEMEKMLDWARKTSVKEIEAAAKAVISGSDAIPQPVANLKSSLETAKRAEKRGVLPGGKDKGGDDEVLTGKAVSNVKGKLSPVKGIADIGAFHVNSPKANYMKNEELMGTLAINWNGKWILLPDVLVVLSGPPVVEPDGSIIMTGALKKRQGFNIPGSKDTLVLKASKEFRMIYLNPVKKATP